MQTKDRLILIALVILIITTSFYDLIRFTYESKNLLLAISNDILSRPATVIASISLIMTLALVIHLIYKIKTDKKDSNEFLDIDKSHKTTGDSLEAVLTKINELGSNSLNKDTIKQAISDVMTDTKQIQLQSPVSFENYFQNIVSKLERQISISDEKASVLLNSGINFAKYGINFFIISIITWQVVSLVVGYKDHFIYGIASCTTLFIFIEFISAWFLKQYKNFIDTSTYLTKIKSIFDKYMLCFLATKEMNKDKHLEQIVAILGTEIKWPETYLLKKGDTGFAKEAIESISSFFELMKSQTKKVCNKEEASDGNKNIQGELQKQS